MISLGHTYSTNLTTTDIFTIQMIALHHPSLSLKQKKNDEKEEELQILLYFCVLREVFYTNCIMLPIPLQN